jgi:hypothetical protein
METIIKNPAAKYEYVVPVTWTGKGTVKVQADSYDEAFCLANEHLPSTPSSVSEWCCEIDSEGSIGREEISLSERIRDILYDMATAGEGECPTVEEIEAQLQSTKGSAYILESLVQFLTGSDEVYKTAMELIHNMEQADDGQAEEESADNLDPCDIPDENGNHHCPYEDYSGYEGERCRVCCGHGVDE